MKLFYTAIFTILFHYGSLATTWTVTVADFSFNPATLNAVVGDVIKFDWVSGTHTTTCGSALAGTSLPSGAQAWDELISSTRISFSYTVTVAGNYLYGCTPHFAFGMQGTIVVSTALPVNFGSFAVTGKNDKAFLQWQTFSESNTDYFSIRKSRDATNFYEIGQVNAAGNSNSIKVYQFTDTDLGSVDKYLYYEIVSVDIDKKESFSPIKTFRNNGVIKENLIVSLSPNPVRRPGQVQLKFNADKAGEMEVSVLNSAGQTVLKNRMAAFYGINSGHLHICDLESGIYNIMFILGGKREVKKVIVQ